MNFLILIIIKNKTILKEVMKKVKREVLYTLINSKAMIDYL